LLMLPAGLHSSKFSTSALVLLLGCLFWAGGTVASRHLSLPRQLSMSAGLQMTWGGGFLFLFSSATGELTTLPTVSRYWNWQLVLAMGYLIVFASIIAFTAYVWLIAREPTTRVASYAYVNPLIALILGSLLAQERPTSVQYAGAALVLAGVASTIAGKRA
jgi:drug/metabolite transporter (DMT)-like permease